jgi:serine/threonine protein kinase
MVTADLRLMNILRIGRYRVLSHLGGGGTSEVYLAEDTLMRRKVALKVLERRDADPRQTQRFEREARCASMLNHPNVVTVFDVGHVDDLYYIASEYIEGETLRQRMQRGPMTALEVTGVGIAVANALVAAHEAWLVHRDIKPENIVIRRDGVIKTLDFGVCTMPGDGDTTDPVLRAGSFVGTLHYLSPEQVRGEPVIDSRSDIYSLGVVLHEMLAGRVPFGATDVMGVLAAITESIPSPLSPLVPQALRTLVERTLRKNLHERPQTAAELLAELTEIRLDIQLAARDRAASGE